MNFKPELAAAVMAGEKTVTRRLVSDNPRSPWWREKCAYRVGQEVAICPGRGKHQIGKARIVSVERMRLGVVFDDEALREGFPTWAHFREAWTQINGAYDADALVWRIGLEAMRAAAPDQLALEAAYAAGHEAIQEEFDEHGLGDASLIARVVIDEGIAAYAAALRRSRARASSA